MNNILIECDGGLGNRLGGLVSGLEVARQCNLNPIINWHTNNVCDCDFFDLFTSNIKVTAIAKDSHDFSKFTVVSHLEIPPHTVPHNKQTIKQILASNKSIYYYNDEIPKYLNRETTIRNLLKIKPIETIKKTVTDFVNLNKIDNSVIGLHIRKTDLNLVDENKYIELVKNSPSQIFFICSDSEEAENKFAEFDNAVLKPKTAYVKKLYNSENWRFKQGIDIEGNKRKYNVLRSKDQVQQALIDMLILSHTNLERTSRHSSFLKFAFNYKTLSKELYE